MPMNCAQVETTSRRDMRLVPVEPHVKSAETRELFNAGVSASARSGKSADPTCYNSPTVELTGLFENVETNMSETIHVERIGRTPTTAIEVCHSPDDGGYYLGHTDFQNTKRRTSVEIYSTRAAAVADWNAGTVKWEPWS